MYRCMSKKIMGEVLQTPRKTTRSHFNTGGPCVALKCAMLSTAFVVGLDPRVPVAADVRIVNGARPEWKRDGSTIAFRYVWYILTQRAGVLPLMYHLKSGRLYATYHHPPSVVQVCVWFVNVGGGFNHVFIFHLTWGNDPIWRTYFFKGVGSTTNKCFVSAGTWNVHV